MKKTLILLLLSTLFVTSAFCEKQSDEQLIKVVTSYANQLVQKNYEAAYNRMSEDYKISTDLNRFESEWKENSNTLGELKKFKTKVVENGCKNYQTVQVVYQFEKGKLYENKKMLISSHEKCYN